MKKTYQKRIKVLCIVFTHTKNHFTRAVAVKDTWLKHCDNALFVTNEIEDSLKSKDGKINVVIFDKKNDTYDNLWYKTKFSFTYVYDNYFKNENRYDYFIKADDDTFVIVENLKRFLKNKDENESYYFGSKMRPHKKYGVKGFMSGGAGYVLSRGSLEKLVTEGFLGDEKCGKIKIEAEDVAVSWCLGKLNILPTYSRDEQDNVLFFPSENVIHYMYKLNNNKDVIQSYMYDPLPRNGINSMPHYPISFHYISKENMRILYYLFYKAKIDYDN
uniref:N-acetylgalactosaminide beta-1,3-galactosyltransferase n=1 Tax=Parastrongyloides trichosuri TaxID=131310 RepID=A0A0N4ZLN1_PARTI